MSLELVFDTLANAQDAYRRQLSKERLFVPCAEPLAPGHHTEVTLRIEETGGAVTVHGTVLHVLDAATAAQHDLGSSAGLVLAIPLVDEVRGPLRDLLTGKRVAAPMAAEDPTGALQEAADGYLAETESRNCYGVLGVAPTASAADIRKAYLGLMKRFHPDNFYGRITDEVQTRLEIAYQRATTAYETLIDARRRDKYDVEIGNFRSTEGGSSAEVKRRLAELEAYKTQNAPRIRKAKQLWDAAMADEQAGLIKEARSKIKLAIDFDPHNPMFPRKLKDLEERLG